jgi:broad specificity phosphatase PhoE
MSPLYVFLRHGEALHNVANRIHGPIAYTFKENEDAALTPLGHLQTKDAGVKIKNIFANRQVDVYCSPLTRCIQTAENAMAHLNVQQKAMEELLIERLGGGHVCNNRKSFHELSTTFPDWNLEYIQDPPQMPLERESLEHVKERMQQIWNWLQETYKTSDRGVLIVSHQESLTALWGRPFKNAEFLVVPSTPSEPFQCV